MKSFESPCLDWGCIEKRGNLLAVYLPDRLHFFAKASTAVREAKNRKMTSRAFILLAKRGTGQEWIRTTEGDASGFTVRPVWPLRYLPVFLCSKSNGG